MVFKCIAINFNCQNRSKKTTQNKIGRITVVLHVLTIIMGDCAVYAVDLKDKESRYFYESGNFCSRVLVMYTGIASNNISLGKLRALAIEPFCFKLNLYRLDIL